MTAIVEAVAAAIITGVATVAAPLLATCGKHTSLAQMHKALKDKLKSLRALQKAKDMEVRRAFTPKDTTEVYLLWMDRVSKIAKEVDSLDDKYKEVRARRFKFFWIELCLKKKIERALDVVIELVEECSEKIVVDKDKLPVRVIKETGVPPIKKYLTLKEAFERVQNLLRMKRVKCVALHGQRGVGKTTIIRRLNNHFYDKMKKFDVVIFIRVPTVEHSTEQTDLRILREIANRINVDKEVTDFDEVARRIQLVLENQRYLLILDGLRHPADEIWEKLGISNDKTDSKVVITTYYPLAWKSKCVDQDVELQPLRSNEALVMFKNIVSDNCLPDRRIARLLCNRLCSCLPLLIRPIARSFNSLESPIQWKEVLEKFTCWPDLKVQGIEELYSNLEICYKPLGQSKQKCFHFASLYPADSKIYTNYLVECCIVQGFLDNADTNKYNEMRSRAIQMLRHLVNIALLEKEEQEKGEEEGGEEEGEQEEGEEEREPEEGEEEGEPEEGEEEEEREEEAELEEWEEEGQQMRYVKMNGFYRQFALYMSSKNSDLECKTYVVNEDEERPSTLKSLPDARWASMIGSKRDSLPTNQNCGSLVTLLLQKNSKLVEIPSDYFTPMENLLVLNLHGTGISKLPFLGRLTKLKAFYLNGCSKLSICSQEIQALECLEIFDTRDTSVNIVPCLKSLRCLRVSYCIASCDQSEGFGSISELHNLEELTIEVKSPRQWFDNAECIVEKVASLTKLTTFRCTFPSSESLEEFEETVKSWGGGEQILHFKFSWGVKTQNIQNSH